MGELDVTFTAELAKSPAGGGWTYCFWPESAVFGTCGRAKIRGTVDGDPFESPVMALGDARHKLPVAVATRKEAGDRVDVRLTERL